MKKEYLRTFLRGILMGLCDLIPGISGGTIAFITGIYERLINAIKGLSPRLVYDILLTVVGKGDRKRLKEDIRKLDLGFLIPLFLGILFALFLFSRVMVFLLERYFSFIMIFFVGLILVSAKTIFEHIEKHHSLNVAFSILGLILGISLVFIIPASTEPSLLYIFVGGFLAICAMLLPGISGSFILLVLGIYSFMLGVLNDLGNKLDYFFAFVVGAICGLILMSRVISLLLAKDKSKTLYFLLGLVVGALSVPLREIYLNIDITGYSVVLHGVLLILGGLAASAVVRFKEKKR